jgi:hypothetical protein
MPVTGFKKPNSGKDDDDDDDQFFHDMSSFPNDGSSIY